MSREAGKGDSYRKVDQDTYGANFDTIFRKNKEVKQHKIISDGISGHNGEHWFKCIDCGKSDWIAGYGSESQLSFYGTPCEK